MQITGTILNSEKIISIKSPHYNLNLQNIITEFKELATDALFRRWPVNLYWMDKNGIQLGCNQKLLNDLKCLSLEEYIGKHNNEACNPQAWENSKKVMETNQTILFEETHVFPDGEEIYYLSIKSPIHDEKNEVIGVLGISINITEQKQIENELKSAKEKAEEANRLKTEFIKNMQHDIRTPFTGILGCIGFLLEQESDPDKYALLADVNKCTEELFNYCSDVMDLANIETGTLPVIAKKFRVSEVLNSVKAIIIPSIKTKQLNLSVDIPTNVPDLVIGDDYRLHRILLNLATNAVKFTETGYVKLAVQIAKREEKFAILQFIIEDTGVGIPKDKKNYIYEAFTRLIPDRRSSGLGLRIVKQFVEEMEGEIDVESEAGKGTTFICTFAFKLPLIQISNHNF